MRGLRDRVVIVTGGAGGIGRATSERFAEEGAAVAVFDKDRAGADEMAKRIAEGGGRAAAFEVDIVDYAAVAAAVNAVESTLGPIHVLVNNAGWDVFRPFLETEPELWQKLIAVNLTGALNLHHIVLPLMVARRAGRVVTIASDAARVGSSGEAVYSACKGGLVALSKTLAREMARYAINVNVVCPGPTDTNLFKGFLEGAGNPDKLVEAFRRSIPLGRLGEPQDLPGAIVFFASDDAAYITGQVLSVSGGLTMAG
jgi:2-hydroxycyclohexanecarboxyl-CoA dehydrogenase